MIKSIKLKQEDRDALQSIHEKISINFVSSFTLSDLAYDAGINTTKLTYGFKQLYGMSVLEFIIHLRMKKAESLLQFTEKDVQVIALLAGYKTKSSFTVAFKKKHGIAPQQWRERNSLIAM